MDLRRARLGEGSVMLHRHRGRKLRALLESAKHVLKGILGNVKFPSPMTNSLKDLLVLGNSIASLAQASERIHWRH